MPTKKAPPPPPDRKAALPGHRLNGFGMSPHGMKLIGHDPKYPKGHPKHDPEERDGPEHPLYDERIQEINRRGRDAILYILQSILEDGYIHWPLVRKNGNDVEVGVGRNRVYAGRVIVDEGLWTKPEPFEVPVVPKKYTDERWRDIIFAENLARKDTDPIAEAIQVAEYMKHNPSPARVKRVLRMTPGQVDKLLGLVQMPDAVRDDIVRHQVPRAVAIEVARMHSSDQLEALRELRASGLMTREAARAVADRGLGIVQAGPRKFYLPSEVTVTVGADGAPVVPAVAAEPAAPAAPFQLVASGAPVADAAPPAAPPQAPAGVSAPVEPPAPSNGTTVPPRALLRDILAEADAQGLKCKVSGEVLATLQWVLTGDADALAAVEKFRPLVAKAVARAEARAAERERRRAARAEADDAPDETDAAPDA